METEWRIYASVHCAIIDSHNGLVPRHGLNQRWLSVNSNLRDKFQWNVNRFYTKNLKKSRLHNCGHISRSQGVKISDICRIICIKDININNCQRLPISELQSRHNHYSDVIMGAVASQITSLTIVYSTVYSGADQRKHQSSASLAFVCGIHRWPVNSTHKGPVSRKMFPFDDVIII